MVDPITTSRREAEASSRAIPTPGESDGGVVPTKASVDGVEYRLRHECPVDEPLEMSDCVIAVVPDTITDS